MHDRRDFLRTLSLSSIGLGLASGASAADRAGDSSEFLSLVRKLLTDWCEGMLSRQIDAPDDSVRHGALSCPSCDFVHGRCWEAVYPFLHLSDTSGDERFLKAAIRLFDWSANVSHPNGAWGNDLNPKSWQGTSIFGAIALADALHYHGGLLEPERAEAWKRRLDAAAGGYLWTDFDTLDFTNINYGATALHGFDLFGRVLGKQKYFDRSRKLAAGIKEYFTTPNALLFGEGKPSDNRSARGLLPVDLGYNVEESLNGIVLYALETKDEELLELLTKSLRSHLEFMLPDGGWDNSWGTRQNKWTYWGSRTSDGCQPGFALMADRDPAFGAAAHRNAELLARCTADGLLHGGPHYVSHGIKPCMHHTFAHAKVLALVLDMRDKLPSIDPKAPLPRETATGVRDFPEIAVQLAASGPWRATVSAYDSIYRTKSEPDHLQQATGGSLAVLHHEKVGLIFAASMAKHLLVEPLNQQPNPGPDFPLTPRLERWIGERWFTNLYDLEAKVRHSEEGRYVRFEIAATLQDLDRKKPADGIADYRLEYQLEPRQLTLVATDNNDAAPTTPARLVLPVISPSGEKVRQVTPNRIEIVKPGGTLVIESTSPLEIAPSEKDRVFNMVPGAEAVPIFTHLPATAGGQVRCTVSVI